jgi:signal transduction histidine kinase
MAMAVELAEVAAGLPVAASLALAGGITSLREGRRRAALNEAMHELRRPLQVLSLSLPADAPEGIPIESSLQLATVALERLDREINGAALEELETEVPIAGLVEEAERRWRPAALRSGVRLEVDQNGEDLWVGGNRFDLSQALDNLLSNAIEHGGGRVRIEWRRESSCVRLSVSDTGASVGAKGSRARLLRRRECRRGHGLRVVGRVARRHGGSFTLSCASQGAQASLRLPLRQRVDAG